MRGRDPRAISGDRKANDTGFSLPVVLWSLLLASLLVIAFLAASRTSIRIASNTASHAEAAALAEAGITIAILDLVEASRLQGVGRRIPVDGEAVRCRMQADADLTLIVEDEAGKVDLNRADESLLRFLLVGVGSSLGEASTLADRILDYRDPDELRRLNGAERDEYRRAGRGSGPSDASFLATEELSQVLGMPERTVERLVPFVTVDSGLPGLDPTVSPSRLIEVLNRGLTNAPDLSLAAETTAARANLPLPPAYRIFSPGTVFRVRAVATLVNGSQAEASAIVELTQGQSRAYQIRRWLGSTPPAGPETTKARDLGAC